MKVKLGHGAVHTVRVCAGQVPQERVWRAGGSGDPARIGLRVLADHRAASALRQLGQAVERLCSLGMAPDPILVTSDGSTSLAAGLRPPTVPTR